MNSRVDSKRWRQQQWLAALPAHGGDIQSAAKRYGIAVEDWLDLSTGMNPEPYPVPLLPAGVFNNLPYGQTDFYSAVVAYYQQTSFLAVAGTQAAIQVLPSILNQGNGLSVLLPDVGYQEHAKQWGINGSSLCHYRSDSVVAMCGDIDEHITQNARQHIVIIQPNNPTAVMVDAAQVLRWSKQLAEHAYIIVDEAFIDTEPEQSLLALASLPGNIIVLRSFGKFFGLAGIRLGFVFANDAILTGLSARVGPWQVSGPAQYVATQALRDKKWQQRALQQIAKNVVHTEALFQPLVEHFDLPPPRRNRLFLAYPMPLMFALAIYDYLANAGVLTRVIRVDDECALLRVGCISHAKTIAASTIAQLVSRLCQWDSMDSMMIAAIRRPA